MALHVFQNSFLGGEIAPSLYGRLDDKLVSMGASSLINFTVLPSGAIKKRSGFKFIRDLGTDNFRLIPFRFSSEQTLVLVFGSNKMYIATQGEFVMSGSSPYTISTPYSDSDIWELSYSQNADVVTFTSPKHAPQELRRYGATDWRFQEITTLPDIEPPTGVTATPTYPEATGGGGEEDEEGSTLSSEMRDVITARYVVTAVNASGEESEPSDIAITKCNYFITGATVELMWDANPKAIAYRVYRYVAGAYGFLAQTDQCSISDLGNTPDTSMSPPHYRESFSGKASDGAIISISVADGGSGYKSVGSSDSDQVLWLTFLPTLYMKCKDNTAGSGEIENRTLYADVKFISPEGQTYTGSTKYDNGNDNKGTGSEEIARHACESYDSKKGFPITMDGPAPRVEPNWTVKVSFAPRSGKAFVLYPSVWKGDSSWPPSDAHFKMCTAEKMSQYQDLWSDKGMPASKVMKSLAGNTETFPLIISGGSGAKANCTVVDGVVKSVQLLAGGKGYSSSAGIKVDAPQGSGASFKVTIKASTPSEYPRCSGQYDQRRVFAGSLQNPLKVWMTAAGKQSLMTYHVPIQDDDRIEIVAVANDADMIKHIIGMESLILLTGSSEMRVLAVNGGAISPRSVGVRVQSYIGANQVKPVVSSNSIIYVAARGGHPRGLVYAENAGSYVSKDLGIRCSHFFDNKDIVDLTLSKAPITTLYAVSTDGKLYASTFLVDQDINAWHQIDVGGKVTAITAVAEGAEDHVYIIVQRNGKACFERMADVTEPTVHLDSFIEGSFSGSVKTVTGLEHLEGMQVLANVDGVSDGPHTVRGGSITLSKSGSHVAVGLPIVATLVTVPFEFSSLPSIMHDRNPSQLYLRFIGSGDIIYGIVPLRPNEHMYEVKRDTAAMAVQTGVSKVASVAVRTTWEWQGQLKLVSTNSEPLEILELMCDAGGGARE